MALYVKPPGERGKAQGLQDLQDNLIWATKNGDLSRRTADEIQAKLDKRKKTVIFGKKESVTGEFRNLGDHLFSSDLSYKSLLTAFTNEVEGKTPSGRSRLATQKMYDILIDRPGQKQTLLAPRSNASKGILGV